MDFLKDIQNCQKKNLNHVETVITKEDGTKLKESSGEVISSDSREFFVIDTTPDEDLHKVIKRVYIGSQDASANHIGLKEKKITHILNVAKYCKNHYPNEFVYKDIAMYDTPEFDISIYFDYCSIFINDSIQNGGTVLCHCNAGVSRSSTIIAVYLMRWHKMTLDEALATIRINRPKAKPNDGFMEKLKIYETSLKL